MTQEQIDALSLQLGKQASEKIKTEFEQYKSVMADLAKSTVEQKGYLTEEQFKDFQAKSQESLDAMKSILEKQGLSLQDLQNSGNPSKIKSLREVLKENEDEFKQIYRQGIGVKYFMAGMDSKGNLTAFPIDYASKAVIGGAHNTTGLSVGTDTVSASITQSLNAQTILRMGGNAPLFNQFRNSNYLLDLVTTVTASWDNPLAVWFEEVAKVGSSNTAVEGEEKPLVQYKYVLKSARYQKEAALLSITEEFHLDFGRLEQNIMEKGRTDVINGIQSKILTALGTAATTYTGASGAFNNAIPFANNYDAIAAMAASVDSATYGNNVSNAALMNTNDKYITGLLKNENGTYQNPPAVLSGLTIVGNPDVSSGVAFVGDFKKYNVIFRGGFIMKVGYNMDDFATNKFSVVLEQFYHHYIPDVNKTAIATGTLATIKGNINDPQTT